MRSVCSWKVSVLTTCVPCPLTTVDTNPVAAKKKSANVPSVALNRKGVFGV